MIGCLSSCDDNAPKPPSKIKLYTGESALAGFIGSKDNCYGTIISYQGEDVCFIDASDPVADEMIAVSIYDYADIQDYIIELNDRCKKWK